MSTLDETTDFARPGGDLSPDLRMVSGIEALQGRLLARYQTDYASWEEDPEFGYNLTKRLNDIVDDPSRIESRAAEEALKDEQVSEAEATVTYDEETETQSITISGESEVGPFDFTLTPDKLTAELFLEAA